MADPTLVDHGRIHPVPPVPFPDRDRPVPHLQVPLTSFVGREREIETLTALLRRPGVRLVTLTGPGGVGKTRLAIAVAEEVTNDFPGGIWCVALAPVRDPALVAATVAQTLGVRETPNRTNEANITEFLRERRALLILDNFEHLLCAGPVITDLLSDCPELTLLVTSRAVLRLSGEHGVAVPPLPLPTVDSAFGADHPFESEAVQLFLERASAARSDFAVDETDAPTIVAICEKLDGLPLAIELAAARVRSLSVDSLLARLSDRLSLLTGGARDLHERQRTMRDTVAWSYDLLTPGEQALFRRLAVFAGSFTLEGAESVADAGTAPKADVFEGVASLLDQSLLRRVECRGGLRFAMLETICEYALEQLRANNEEAEVRDAHAAYFVALAERADPSIWGGPEQRQWLDRLEAELTDLRAALTWLDETGDGAAYMQLAAALGGLWTFRSHRIEGYAWLMRGLDQGADTVSAARAMALVKLGMLERDLGGSRAAEFTAEGVALRRALGDERGVGRALLLLSVTFDDRMDQLQAAEEAKAILERLGDITGVAWSRLNFAAHALELGDHDRAQALMSEALSLFRQDGFHFGIVSALVALGRVKADCGDITGAAVDYAESLRLRSETGSNERVLDALAGAGWLSAIGGRAELATRFLGAAAALGEALGYVPSTLQRSQNERAMSAARASLSDADFEAAWAGGRALSTDQAADEVAEILAAMCVPGTCEVAEDATFGLTPREVEVVRLVATGRTNQEIADSLFISHGTARTHVQHVLNKLSLDSRTAIAAWAIREGLA